MSNMSDTAWEAAIGAFRIEAGALLTQSGIIDRRQFAAAVDALIKAPRIAASGCGHSGIACMHFAHLMCCIKRPARFISPAEAVHGALGFLKAGDVILLASRGGKTSELLPILEYGNREGITVISVIENMESPMALQSDIVLDISVERETDKHNTQGTTSFAVMNAVFDALQAAIIEETGYNPKSFAIIHPGGAVGERLNERSR